MRSELGKITLDKTFEERDALNENIVVCHLICNLNMFVALSNDHTVAFGMEKMHMSYVLKTSNRLLLGQGTQTSLRGQIRDKQWYGRLSRGCPPR